MNHQQHIQTKTLNLGTIAPMSNNIDEIFRTIISELRLLRNEVSLILPQEDLEDCSHPDRILNSYQNAIKKYPPVSLLK